MTAARTFTKLAIEPEFVVQMNRVLSDTVGELTAEEDWIQLTPSPEMHSSGNSIVKGRDGRKFRFPDGLVESFNQAGEEIPVDIEHEAEMRISKDVAGWVRKLEIRNNQEIWGNVKWNTLGKKLLKNQAYRSVSVAFFPTRDSYKRFLSEEQDFLDADFFTSVALTNFPNLKVRSLNSRQDTMDRKLLTQTLQLNAESSDEDILQHLSHLVGLNKNIDKMVPRADYDLVLTQLNSLKSSLDMIRKEQLHHKVLNAVDQAIADGKISPASKDFYVESCFVEGGLERFKKFSESAPKILNTSSQFEGRKEPTSSGSTITEAEKKIAELCGYTVEDYIEFGKYLPKEGVA